MERVRLGASSSVDVGKSEPQRLPGDAAAARGAAFREHLSEARHGRLKARLDQLLHRIETQGGRLAQSFALSDLKHYKETVRAFLREVLTQGFAVKKETNWDHGAWEHRTLVTVKVIDNELEELTRLLLEQEQDHLQIMAKIGEIKGLLVDCKL